MSSKLYDILKLRAALQKSLAHHDYCGWGDSWERKVAETLEPELNQVIKDTAHYEEKQSVEG